MFSEQQIHRCRRRERMRRRDKVIFHSGVSLGPGGCKCSAGAGGRGVCGKHRVGSSPELLSVPRAAGWKEARRPRVRIFCLTPPCMAGGPRQGTGGQTCAAHKPRT